MGERRRNRRRKGGGSEATSRAAPGDGRPRGAAGGAVLQFTAWTAIFGAAGLLTAVAGFFLLSQGSLAFAPVLLVVAFLVFFPLALTR